MSDFHILPIDDLRTHDETRECWCQPRVELAEIAETVNAVVIHNSADGRELVEEHGVN